MDSLTGLILAKSALRTATVKGGRCTIANVVSLYTCYLLLMSRCSLGVKVCEI